GLVLIGLAAWSFGQSQGASGSWRWLGRAAALVTALAALAILPGLKVADREHSAEAAGEAFSRARLASLRAEGRPVFVDMTAAWCVTCLVNERVALSPKSVQDAFAARGVVYLRGDWTRHNPEITAFLREHGRDGVPLYVLYPARGEPT